MLAIRLLTGPQRGQTFNLKMGRNILGRSPSCDVKISSAGVSKEHAEINVQNDKVTIIDLKSSNGTFINGVKVQNGVINKGDKIGLHDILFDIVPVKVQAAPTPPAYPMQQQQHLPPAMNYHNPQIGILSEQVNANVDEGKAFKPDQGFVRNLIDKLFEYLEKVALPGFYKLAEYFEVKMIVLTLIIIFIFATTALSLIPMVKITKSSILSESKRRALSIARSLATYNQNAVIQGSMSTLSTHNLETEEGVKQILLIQQSDGMILAPAIRAGTIPNLPFVHKARRELRSLAEEVDSSTIGASFPIGLFDSSTGEQAVKAHAIVLYDVSTLSFDEGQVISLFMQTLIIATFIGLILFYLIYKLTERPIIVLNEQLDIALREKKDNTETGFKFPAVQALTGNINTLLTRYLTGDSNLGSVGANKDVEAYNIAQLIPYPSVTISSDGRIISVNMAFSQLTHISSEMITNQNLTALPDQALQQNIGSLMELCRANPSTIQKDALEFAGHAFNLSCQAILNDKNEIVYFVIVVSPSEGGQS